MNQLQDVQTALDMDRLKLPAWPKVKRLEWQFYEDSSGEDALQVRVLLDDATKDEELAAGSVHDLKWEIINSLRRNGVTLFPYFFFSRECEFETATEKTDG